jgi:uncharacterized protein YndB with AHSA1/START domain
MNPSVDPAREIRLTRTYDAPLALVWEAWTKPEHLAKWWGPRGFTITTHARDLRVGGIWDYTMHGPDGKDWPNFTRYHEVVPESRLVYDHGASAADGKPLFRVTATFRDIGGRTELDIVMLLETPEAARETRVFIKMAGGNSTWDRLAEYVEQQHTQREIFVVARSFDVSVERLYELWTTPEHVVQWLPPTGFSMTFRRVDMRLGGHGEFVMSNGDASMQGRFTYVEMQRPDRLVYTQCFLDAEGQVLRHLGPTPWPGELRNTVIFTAEGPNQSRVTVRTEVEGAASAEEVSAFLAERGGMTRGWSGSFDKLDAELAAVQAA